MGSSSRKKSSKKKIPKISSEARQKKRSRKIKSKKLRRHDESISSYSGDELSSSLSDSSSSSEDDYRSRKSRSRARGDVKGSRKRARRSSSSRGSSVDSPRIKKKKHNGHSESKKKLSKKKKKKKTKRRKRDSSISSVSSDTHSCSTCQGENDSGSERLRERSREKKKSKRNSGKGRSITRKNRDRSRSFSPSSKLSDSVNNNTIELFAIENNSRRLRSVITVVTREEESEGNEENKDEFKEEIVYDHDDYPSCRSNDSNEAKRESAHRTMENVIEEDPSVSNLKALEPLFTSKNGSDKYEELECSSDGAGNVSPKEKESDVKDLELILRQRALENLKRFKGGHQMKDVVPVDEKNKNNNENKPLSNVETELVPNKRAVENLKRSQGGSQINEVVPLDEGNKSNNEMKLPSTGEAEFVQNNQLKQEDPGIMGASESAARKSRFTWKRDSSIPTITEEKIPPKKIGGTNSAAVKLTDATLRHLSLPSGSGEARNVRPLASRLQTLPKVKSALTESIVNKSAHKKADGASQTLAESSSNTRDIGITQTLAESSSNTGDIGISQINETPSSVIAEEGSSREQQNDAKDGSQFEQKTMTVMRGGELVQVNYKVYIPKKVPALARRQLKR